MSIETIAGVDVHVVRRGQGTKPILYLHCSLAHHEAFIPLLAPFEDTHQVTFFDLPGHGRSQDLPEGCDIQTITANIARELLADGAHVIGHSFGATVALRMALEGAPITGLTLIEPVMFAAARGSAGYAQHERDFAPFNAALDVGDREEAARGFLRIWGLNVRWKHLPARARAEAMRSIHSITDAEPALHHDVHNMLRPGGLEALSMPVTLIEGTDSHPVIKDIHDGLEARLPNVRRVALKGGHMVPLTDAQSVITEIARDLA